MTRAYNEYYLNDAKKRLSTMFDYAINDMLENADDFAGLFLQSGIAELFEQGNPGVISGKSGIELVRNVMSYAYSDIVLPVPTYRQDKTPEYWAGWALAEYQWYSGRSFRDIFAKIPLSKIISMYKLYHEMDISQFIDAMEQMYEETFLETKLKTIRENRGLSQIELARLSGVNFRSIQMYEQRVNDIDKAQGHTLFKLARVLGCSIEDLLEYPLKTR